MEAATANQGRPWSGLGSPAGAGSRILRHRSGGPMKRNPLALSVALVFASSRRAGAARSPRVPDRGRAGHHGRGGDRRGRRPGAGPRPRRLRRVGRRRPPGDRNVRGGGPSVSGGRGRASRGRRGPRAGAERRMPPAASSGPRSSSCSTSSTSRPSPPSRYEAAWTRPGARSAVPTCCWCPPPAAAAGWAGCRKTRRACRPPSCASRACACRRRAAS
jgi:hypothetical protein